MKKHDKENFQVPVTQFANAFIPKGQARYDAQLKDIRDLGKTIDGGLVKALDSKDAGERLLAASILVLRYRYKTIPDVKEVDIDAAESKKILKALTNADLTKRDPRIGLDYYTVFVQLGQPGIDAYNPKDSSRAGQIKAAHDWLVAHGGKYRIKRVIEKAGK